MTMNIKTKVKFLTSAVIILTSALTADYAVSATFQSTTMDRSNPGQSATEQSILSMQGTMGVEIVTPALTLILTNYAGQCSGEDIGEADVITLDGRVVERLCWHADRNAYAIDISDGHRQALDSLDWSDAGLKYLGKIYLNNKNAARTNDTRVIIK